MNSISVELFKKAAFRIIKLLFVSITLVVVTSCVMNTTIVRNPRICRQYYLLPNISMTLTDDAYSDLSNDNKINIANVLKTETANIMYSHLNFYYDGNFDFRFEYQTGEIFERSGTYSINDGTNITSLIFEDETIQCKNTFSKKADGDTLITYLRVPYTLTLEGSEQDVYMWFFNGIFGACPFPSGE